MKGYAIGKNRLITRKPLPEYLNISDAFGKSAYFRQKEL